jgi:hypothetical protein
MALGIVTLVRGGTGTDVCGTEATGTAGATAEGPVGVLEQPLATNATTRIDQDKRAAYILPILAGSPTAVRARARHAFV